MTRRRGGCQAEALAARQHVSAVLTFMQRRSAQESGAAPRLSAREAQVAALVGDAMSDREIADRLGLSLRTAEDHVHNIIKKVGYSSRRAIRAGDYPGNG